MTVADVNVADAKPRLDRKGFDFARTGPGTLAGRYMRSFWQPIFVADRVRAGEAFHVRVMSQDLTLYRGESGDIHAIAGHCAHRGTQLSTGYVEGDCLRCLYHGWKYDASGQCVEQPAEPGGGFADKIRIASYPVREYLGLVFAYLGEGEPPPLPRYREFEADGDTDLLFADEYSRACNYFQNVENGVDEAHLPFTHRKTGFDVLNRDVPIIDAEETEYGLKQFGRRSDGTVRVTHFLMPNILTFVHPGTSPDEIDWPLYMSWRVPVDDLRHKTFSINLVKLRPNAREAFREHRREMARRLAELPSVEGVTADILADRARLFDFEDRPDFLNLQDHVTQVGQGEIADRSAEHLGRSDIAIALLRKLWLRDLQAIAAGGRRQDWHHPDQFDRPKGV
jgi:5,5'-dehydrodivanillate O-demethylase